MPRNLIVRAFFFWSVVLLLAAPLITSALRHVRGDLTQDGIACRDLYKRTQGGEDWQPQCLVGWNTTDPAILPCGGIK